MKTRSATGIRVAAAAAAVTLAILPAQVLMAQDQPIEQQPLPEAAENVAPEPESPTGPLPGQTRIGVVAFESPPQVDTEYQVGQGLADMLITALVNQHRFWVIERTRLEDVLIEQDLGLEGILDPAGAARAGQVLGVQYLIMGKVTNFGFRGREAAVGAAVGGILSKLGGLSGRKRKAQVAIDVRMVAAEGGRIVLSKKASGESSEGGGFALGGDPSELIGLAHVQSEEFENSMIGRACRKAIDELVKVVVDYFPFACRVATVANGNVYLDAGKFQGLTPGMTLRVLREKPVTDSKGTVVFVETTELGTITIVAVTNDGAKAKADPGAGSIQEGDKVMMLEKAAVKQQGKKKGSR